MASILSCRQKGARLLSDDLASRRALKKRRAKKMANNQGRHKRGGEMSCHNPRFCVGLLSDLVGSEATCLPFVIIP